MQRPYRESTATTILNCEPSYSPVTSCRIYPCYLCNMITGFSRVGFFLRGTLTMPKLPYQWEYKNIELTLVNSWFLKKLFRFFFSKSAIALSLTIFSKLISRSVAYLTIMSDNPRPLYSSSTKGPSTLGSLATPILNSTLFFFFYGRSSLGLASRP